MKAVVIHGQRDLRIESIDPAPPPGPGEVQLRVAHGGICGSDLHYYLHGGFGAIRIQEPMALGHEVSGVIAALGDGVEGLQVGDKVAVNPSRPCTRCEYCLRGQPNGSGQNLGVFVYDGGFTAEELPWMCGSS